MERRRAIRLEKRYLHFPVQTGAESRRLRLEVSGETVREFDIELALDAPDFWAFLEAEAWQGQTVTVVAELPDEQADALERIRQSDAALEAADLYREPLRQQFHFSSRRGWNNDPNGLVYFKGEWHLYYQHNPYGWNWGNMHWGHAVSPDLVHWTELPIALAPKRYGDWAFSGSAWIDAENTSGFGRDGEPPLMIAYTSTGRGECIAYSLDRGRTFTEVEGNPVVTHAGRDPKVIWYAPGNHWTMAVYEEAEEKRWIAFYTSPDLKTWTAQSRIEGYYECPELFELPIDGDPNRRQWIVYGADGQYQIGAFDGKTFTPETERIRYHFGDAFYASQTYSDAPDERRIQIAWGTIPTPGMPFNQCTLFPVELALRSTPDGLRLCPLPVREIESLYRRTHAWTDKTLTNETWTLEAVAGDLLDVEIEFSLSDAAQATLQLAGAALTYDAATQELIASEECRIPLPLREGIVRLRVLRDRVSLEVFAQSGEIYVPLKLAPGVSGATSISVSNGTAHLRSLVVRELRSIWNRPDSESH